MKNSKKILWITERFPPLTGGMAVSAKRQVDGLRRRGFETDVLVFNINNDMLRIKKKQQDGGKLIVVSHPDEPGNAAQRGWREILSQHSQKNYDLVFGFGAGFSGYIATSYSAWLKIPSMVSVRGNDFDRDWFEAKKAYFVKEALSRADYIACVTNEKKDKIKSLFPDKNIFWSPNGIAAEQFELLPAEKEESLKLKEEMCTNGRRIIGIFGELKYKKRIPMWLSAVRNTGLTDKISLIVAGKMDAETQAVFSDPDLCPPGKHLSFRPPDKLLPIYAACDYIVIPSLFEGFPNVLLEAMASGCIPIVSDSGSMKDVISHKKTGFLFTAENKTEAGMVTKEALSLSENQLKSMKNEVIKHIKENFTIVNEINILEENIIKAIN